MENGYHLMSGGVKLIHGHNIYISGNWRYESMIEWVGIGTCNPATGDIQCSASIGREIYNKISCDLKAGRTSGSVTDPEGDFEITYKWRIGLISDK